jgi:ADP-dependent NAD(P)H-hydrate dehydratase / NAD(P)H-hydrate epimerase
MPDNRETIQEFVVTAKQMHEIESRVFAAGMPVAALMEKVGGRIAHRILALYPDTQQTSFGVLVGPGHNGGDALVVARELHFQGYTIKLYSPFTKFKDLTALHANYAASLGIPSYSEIEVLQTCEILIDGLFGFGLEQKLEESIAAVVDRINEWAKPVLSIDLPSGLHTDSGKVMGTAIRATQTFCLGLWKVGLLQDQALEYVGRAELIDFDLPLSDIQAVLGQSPELKIITRVAAISHLPLDRPPDTHKYKMGHLLLICGSSRYQGAAILAGLGARASGVGMLSIAVPESLKAVVSHNLPEALVLRCPETVTGALMLTEELVAALSNGKYSAIACGPGLTKEAHSALEAALTCPCPLILDADGLNILAELGPVATLAERKEPTVLTPHAGEFKRLFPELSNAIHNRVQVSQTAAKHTGAVILLKGARAVIAHPQGTVWINPDSTPALARGGSGDVLTGLIAGLLAQLTVGESSEIATVIASAAWWHAQAGIAAAKERTVLGVDALTLSQFLIPTLCSQTQQPSLKKYCR